jgi:hypothetical protein
MFKRKNILKHATVDDAFPNITPAKTNIPEWYKKQNRFKSGNKEPKRMPFPMTFKMCSAFSDSFTTGYMYPLAVDICVEQTEGGPVITWSDPNISIISLRIDDGNDSLPTPAGFSNLHFAWQSQHMIEIPKGYTAFLSHPFNRFDLPFITLSGFADGEMVLYNGNIPVFFNNTFEGIIPAGTPIVQVFLFKTENWNSKFDKSIINKGNILNNISTHTAYGWYKKNIWKKKLYD